MLIGLETFSYYLAFSSGKMDMFSFIHQTKDLGLEGIQINMEGDDLGHLRDDSPGYLKKIRSLCDDLGLFIDLDACGTSPDKLLQYLDICTALGVDRLRIFSSFGGDVQQEMQQAVRDFTQVMPAFSKAGVAIAYENHEYETARDIMDVIAAVNSPAIGAHIDTGNSMMLWEDPLDAVRTMAPKACSSHFKDHLVIDLNGTPVIIGVPLGTGTIDLAACYAILADSSPLERINIEVCYGYLAPFRVEQAKGQGGQLDQGAFAVSPPPFDPKVVAPHLLKPKKDGFKSHAWQEIINLIEDSEREQLIAWQYEAVESSVAHMKQIRQTHQQEKKA